MSDTLVNRLLARAITAAGRGTVEALLRQCAQDCETRAAAATGSSRRARTPRAAKAKGRKAVVAVRDWLLQTFPELEPDDILIQTTSVGGQDLHLSPRAQRLFPFAIESKNVEAFNPWAALAQAEINARKKVGLRPVLFFKRNDSPHYIAFPLTDFTEVYLCPSTKPPNT